MNNLKAIEAIVWFVFFPGCLLLACAALGIFSLAGVLADLWSMEAFWLAFKWLARTWMVATSILWTIGVVSLIERTFRSKT